MNPGWLWVIGVVVVVAVSCLSILRLRITRDDRRCPSGERHEFGPARWYYEDRKLKHCCKCGYYKVITVDYGEPPI